MIRKPSHRVLRPLAGRNVDDSVVFLCLEVWRLRILGHGCGALGFRVHG